MCTDRTAGERSFSRLKLFKTLLRSSLSQNNLQNFRNLSIECEFFFVKSLNLDDVIRTFSNAKYKNKEICIA